jgi:hypothetical protein
VQSVQHAHKTASVLQVDVADITDYLFMGLNGFIYSCNIPISMFTMVVKLLLKLKPLKMLFSKNNLILNNTAFQI